MKAIIAFLFPGWVLYESETAIWEKFRQYELTPYQKHYATYDIYYSKRRDKYKLKISGHNPRQHPYYATKVQQLVKLNKV